MKKVTLFTVLALLAAPLAMADTTITFDEVSDAADPFELTTAISGVTFYIGLDTPGTNQVWTNAWIHTGGTPTTAFDANDDPPEFLPADIGQFIGDDQRSVYPNDLIPVNLFMQFDTAVTSLSLDLYDYGDFMVNSGDKAFLFGYTDAGWQTLDASYDSLAASGDNTETMSVVFNAPVRSAALVFISNGSNINTGSVDMGDGNAFDNGWGVDNVTFSVVPEPATMGLMGLGLAGLAVSRYRRKRS